MQFPKRGVRRRRTEKIIGKFVLRKFETLAFLVVVYFENEIATTVDIAKRVLDRATFGNGDSPKFHPLFNRVRAGKIDFFVRSRVVLVPDRA